MNKPKPLPDTLAFGIGSAVYHKTEPSKMGVVTAIIFYPGGYFYEIQWTTERAGKHYEFELNGEPSFEA